MIVQVRVTRCVCERIAQIVVQAVFGRNENIKYTAEISSPIVLAISVICKKLPKENSHPTGENSPNPVTLPSQKLQKNGHTEFSEKK
jgi:hypothetical protein